MRVTGILDFLDVAAAAAFDVPPAQAIAYFQGKGLKASFSYADMLRDEHRTAFTIAKMMDIDLLKDVQDSLDMALADGIPFSEWKKQIIPVLQAKGWLGKANMIDPLTGELKRVTLGTPHRLATIFRTNMQASYAVGAWEQIEAQAADAPYLMYDAVDDFRTRPAHRAWDGKVIRWDDKWWRTHYPPNGFNCRCSVIQLDDNDLESMGLTADKAPRNRFENWRNPRTGQVERIPEGIDPGFDHNPGKRRMEELGKLQDEKIKALPKNMRKKAQDGAKKAEEAAKATEVFDTSTDAGKWHAKSWDGAPDWVRASIIREQAVEVSTGSGGAWARGGHLIHMSKYTPDNAQQRGVWRHEFGHVLDYRLQPGFDYYSAGQEFTKAMQADSRDLLKRTSIGMTMTSRQQRVHFLRQYDEIRDAIVDIDGRDMRQAFLRQEAKRIGIDFDDLVTMLKENSEATFDGISGEVKLARILRAIEIGDAERFVYEAVGMDSSDWHVRRESLKKGNLGSFSDLIGAATGNKAANHHDGFAGHSNSYYRRPGARQTEVFANLTSLAGGPHPILWELAQRFFPKVTKAYQEALIRGNRL